MSALARSPTARGLHISIEEIPDQHEECAADHLVTVYGADRTGIVYRVSSVLSQSGVNVTDLDTRLAWRSGAAGVRDAA